MSMKGFECPNCGSGYASAIRFWRDGKQIDGIDVYACHDCGQCTKAGTKIAVSPDWQPERTTKKSKIKAGQLDIFGGVVNIRDTINPVPKYVEAPSGEGVTVALFPQDATPAYREELQKMILETNRGNTKRENPYWYKYRKIKRSNNGR